MILVHEICQTSSYVHVMTGKDKLTLHSVWQRQMPVQILTPIAKTCVHCEHKHECLSSCKAWVSDLMLLLLLNLQLKRLQLMCMLLLKLSAMLACITALLLQLFSEPLNLCLQNTLCSASTTKHIAILWKLAKHALKLLNQGLRLRTRSMHAMWLCGLAVL